MTELKPCPFCGGEATIGTVEYGQDSQQKRLNGQSLFFYGSCTMCGANNQGIVGHKSGAIATAKWNTRATPSPSPSREGWLTREQVQKELDRLNAMDVDGVHPENQADAFYELEFQRALCDMALSALRPAGDEGKRIKALEFQLQAVMLLWDALREKPEGALFTIDECVPPIGYRAVKAALPAAPKSPASERKA